jgi:phage terminase small subunit
MGLRGKLPTETIKAPQLKSLDAPSWLSQDAQAYWTQHAINLQGTAILTHKTAESFALLCDLWARVREMGGGPTNRAYLDAVRSYVSLAKQFRLLPTEKPTETPTDRHADKPEFDFNA